MRALILNDTRRGDHPGCMLVMHQLLAGCDAAEIQVTKTLRLGRFFQSALKSEIKKVDVVIINGEGTMHHDSAGALMLKDAGLFAHKCRKPVFLINSVWEGNNVVNQLLPCLYKIVMRESLSAECVDAAGFTADVIPDLTLSSDYDVLFPYKNSAPESIVVMDDVCWHTAMLLARYARSRGYKFLRMASRPSLRSISGIYKWFALFRAGKFSRQFVLDDISLLQDARIIVTGRFHGACLAILAERPFIALSSNTHKVEGLLKDAKLGDCAVLLNDTHIGPEPMKALDEAVAHLDFLSKQTSVLDEYKLACRKYREKAKLGAANVFSLIAAVANKGIL
jgi:polysaccharide pyruvyl transferase WcaK-like protein